MKHLALDQLADLGEFTGGGDLTEYLKQSNMKSCNWSALRDIRISPDGQHIHVILHKPKGGLMTFDRLQRTHQLQNHKHLDLGSGTSGKIVDLVYLGQRDKDGGSSDLAVVQENGGVEFWRYEECKAGWYLQQTSELCNSPRAKVVSVCASGNVIIWSEERPPSESSLSSTAARNNFQYCICTRTYELEERGVCLGGVNIMLHNSPRYAVIASADNVYLLPDNNETKLSSISKFFLTWSPDPDSITVSSACKGTLLRKDLHLSKESDFKRLISDCVGLLSTINPPEIIAFSATGCGGLLVLLGSGWISMLQKDGVLRRIYKLADNCLYDCSLCSSMHVYGGVLALTVDRTLYLIDIRCGTELEKIPLKKEGVLFVNCRERNVPHLLTESGLFVAKQRERDLSPKTPGHSESISPESLLVEAVFEEACKYYQRRSLSSTQLTVEKLKSGGMFQAPIALSSILKGYLKTQKTGERILGGTSGTYTKLLSSLDAELKSLVALEELKSSLVKASETELALHCENLVSEEVSRLLCTELDRENLLYLNVIFSTFPLESWQALQMALQLRSYEEGSLSAKAAPEVWKTVLSPVPAGHATPPNGQQCPPANGAVPVFELICQSLFRFQPRWLPRFVELAQQQQAGISSWNYGAKDSPDSPPLYKRALAILPEKAEYQEVEVELLLCSQRPNAVMQALRLLMQLGKWGQVAQVAERFCQQSPLLNKEIFTTLLGELSQHRDLDPYLDLLWTLCPEDLTVTSILNIVLKNLPPSTPERGPFQTDGSHLTVGLLKPLLSKVLQRETKPSQRYADILQSPSFPPPTPPRRVKGPPRAVTEPAMDYQDPRPRTPPVPPVTTASPS
ncbi:BLOC-2 complex member HPS6 [Lepisosteus oculatus]|uniref:BLOC-2 complex member HPS6 n=1 Tax=Lepisosteus oculatus TaxID=7918 RepID=UPI0037145C59